MLNRKVTMSNLKKERSQPFLVRLFLAIMAFKRMIAMRRRWEITKKQKSQPLKSTLILEIHKSQRAVKVASFGRSVVVLNEDKIRQYRQLEYEKRLKEKEKRMELQQLKSKRRFGMRTYGDIKSFENAAPGSPTSGGGGSNFDPYSLTVADRIRALKSNYSPADFFRDENGTKRPQTASSKQSFSKDPATPTPATAAMTTTNKDLTNILQKNTHISKPQNSGAEGSKWPIHPHPLPSLVPIILFFSSLQNQIKPEKYAEIRSAGGSELCPWNCCVFWCDSRNTKSSWWFSLLQ